MWVFDKRHQKSYASSIKDTASERYYNDGQIGDLTFSFETRLERIESLAAPVIAKVVESENIGQLDEEETASLVSFIATQIIRGKGWRESSRQTYELLCEKLGGKDRAVAAGLPPLSEDEEKFAQLKDFHKTMVEFAPALITKMWMLHRSRKGQEFLLGDEPVVRQNTTPSDGITGNTGLACEGVEIYLPLSPHLTLALLCPTLRRIFEMSTKVLNFAAVLEAERFLAAVDTGKPFLLRPENVQRLNALQIVHANRFLMASENNFDQVKKMISARPELSATPRYVS